MKEIFCDQCGRPLKKGNHLQGYVLCSKHMHQLYNFGKFLDAIPRTNKDLNDYKIVGDTVYINLYNQKNIKIGECIIDLEYLDKVKYNKWRLSHQHVVTGSGKQNIKDISWYILNCFKEIKAGYVVDHINGNALDNRKVNLRLCTQSDNVLNKSRMTTNTSNYMGVSFDKKRNKWCAEIRYQKTKIHFRRKDNILEAVLQRYFAEKLLFREYANREEQHKKKMAVQRLEKRIVIANAREVLQKVYKLRRGSRHSQQS